VGAVATNKHTFATLPPPMVPTTPITTTKAVVCAVIGHVHTIQHVQIAEQKAAYGLPITMDMPCGQAEHGIAQIAMPVAITMKPIINGG